MIIYYLSSIVPRKGAEKLSGISIAGNNMENGIFDSLIKEKEFTINSYATYPIAAWPTDKCFKFKEQTIEFDNGHSVIYPKFVNIPYFKQFSQSSNLYKHLKKDIKKKSSKDDVLIVTFNCFPQVGMPAYWIKKKYRIKLVSVVADLPIDVIKRNFIGRFFRRIFDKLTLKIMKRCDGVVVLNKNVMDKYGLTCDYSVCEGAFCGDINRNVRESTKKNIVYTGTLNEYNGIKELIEAFSTLDKCEFSLDIYGDGPLEKYVTDVSKEIPNINYFGKKSNSEICFAQHEAYILINPRPTNDLVSGVTFPSKLFEYLASGRPVISTLFEGLPEEYKSHLFLIDSNSPETIKNKIIELDSYGQEELNRIGQENQLFIKDNKTWDKQGNIIVSLIKDII